MTEPRPKGRLLWIVGGILGLCVLSYAIVCAVQIAWARAALQSTADRLKTEPTMPAIGGYIDRALKEHYGASQSEIHDLLNSIGDFEYKSLGTVPTGQNQVEEARWIVGSTPTGRDFLLFWTLTYREGRLIEAAQWSM